MTTFIPDSVLEIRAITVRDISDLERTRKVLLAMPTSRGRSDALAELDWRLSLLRWRLDTIDNING